MLAGFIDFIVEPTFNGLIDTAEKIIGPLIEEERKAKETGNRRSRYFYYNFFERSGKNILLLLLDKYTTEQNQCHCYRSVL